MKFVVFIISFLMAFEAWAHTRWLMNGTLPPRTDDSGIKASGAPCGVRKYNTRTKLQAGQALTIQWEETIDHPGHYEIWFSPENDQAWQLLKTIPDDQAGRTNQPHYFSNVITVPNTTCTNCTFQIRQYMTDKNPPSYYFSCADVDISPNNPPLSSPGTIPSSTSNGSNTTNSVHCGE